jgi:formylglycine-generating enzyme required for sulfatase activity
MKSPTLIFLLVTHSVLLAADPATVPVGNPGNQADTTGYGAVAYSYKIGKYEVTNEEYAEFLNAVAKTDTHEWHKAAYYDPKKSGGAGYWPYATKGGSAPEANLGSNNPTDVGSISSGASPYGTFDQNGNAWEYNEHQYDGKVGLRGGSWFLNDNDSYLQAATRYDVLSAKWPHYGFRVVALGGGESKKDK